MIIKKYDCCCIGRSCVDYIVLVKKYPIKNTKVELTKYKITLGGQGANSAVALSKLGLKTLLITPIGNDDNGKFVKQILSRQTKLSVKFIIRNDIRTPCAFIWTEEETAERTIVYEKIIAKNLYPKDIIENAIKEAKYVLFDHQSCESIYKVRNLFIEYNTKLVMDAERKDKYLFKLLPYINYFICSKELADALGLSPKELLKKFINLGPKIVCCTLGEKGAVAICSDDKNKIYYSKAIKVKAVDTTGAGDIFHSGFVYGLVKGWKIKKILNFANYLAGKSTLYLGGNKL